MFDQKCSRTTFKIRSRRGWGVISQGGATVVSSGRGEGRGVRGARSEERGLFRFLKNNPYLPGAS